jgi:hypothetical protein
MKIIFLFLTLCSIIFADSGLVFIETVNDDLTLINQESNVISKNIKNREKNLVQKNIFFDFTKLKKGSSRDLKILFLERINDVIHKQALTKDEILYLSNRDLKPQVEIFITKLQISNPTLFNELSALKKHFKDTFLVFNMKHKQSRIFFEERVVYTKVNVRNHPFLDIKMPRVKTKKRGRFLQCQILILDGQAWCKEKYGSNYIALDYTRGLTL